MDPVSAVVAILKKDRAKIHKEALRAWLANGLRKPRISEVRKALGDFKVTDAKLKAMGCMDDAG